MTPEEYDDAFTMKDLKSENARLTRQYGEAMEALGMVAHILWTEYSYAGKWSAIHPQRIHQTIKSLIAKHEGTFVP